MPPTLVILPIALRNHPPPVNVVLAFPNTTGTKKASLRQSIRNPRRSIQRIGIGHRRCLPLVIVISIVVIRRPSLHHHHPQRTLAQTDIAPLACLIQRHRRPIDTTTIIITAAGTASLHLPLPQSQCRSTTVPDGLQLAFPAANTKLVNYMNSRETKLGSKIKSG